MKAILALGTVLGSALLVGCQSPACPQCNESGAATNEVAPVAASNQLDRFEFTTHQGEVVRLADLQGAPTAISFVYTRCQNQRKCPLVARTMAQLRADLERAAVRPLPKLVLITYDPEFDTPARLKQFGEQSGFLSGTNTLLLRPDPAAKEAFFKALNVAVNFYGDAVNIHGIQLLLLDKEGRLRKSYRGLIWDNREVLSELQALAH